GASVEASVTLRNVGVDAIGEGFTADYLAEVLEGRTAVLKSALLDQSRIAGLGNIYVCEALFQAQINPEARCCDVRMDEVRRLHRAICGVLTEAIAADGTTISDYVTGRRVPGSFQERLQVYGREGEICRRSGCDATITRIVQSNRSTFYCPGCQRGRRKRE
ncbi:MAG: zinc finger domain-containing protein, partial [Armatimonadota bacterium]